MKPSWDDAPEWAQWLAMDAGDTWFWYANKPYLEFDDDNNEEEPSFWDSEGKWLVSKQKGGDAHWATSLEPRQC